MKFKLNPFLNLFAIVSISVIITQFSSCSFKDKETDEPTLSPLATQVRIQVAHDASEVAFKFTWKSQQKLYPASMANVGQNYPGQFHDVLKHDGALFNRLPSGQRLEEDRVSLIIDNFSTGAAGFGLAGCAVACHENMESHHLLTDNILDHWHWRGARSGPMGYSEDVAINNVERIRDNLGTPPVKFLRSGGDRLRENQGALSGTVHDVLVDRFPRFVFHKGKTMPGNYVIPSYFLTNEAGNVIVDPYAGIPQVRDLSKNRSLLVGFQDYGFDADDKLNSLDVGYLVWIAFGETGHLPLHLRDESSADFTVWKNFWASQTNNINATNALNKLNEMHSEWTQSSKNAMVTRGIGFIYNSDQHDVTSERFYDAMSKEWTVILYRKLTTGSDRDADLSGLPTGVKYAFSFAMHDSGSGSVTHDISLPYSVSNTDDADLKASAVTNVYNTEWNKIPALDTEWVKQALMPKYTLDWLKSGAHAGAGGVGVLHCNSCHTGNSSLLNTTKIN